MTEPADNERKERIQFESAPVNEVVIGLYHVPITELRAQHIGIYWYTIRDRYPLCEQQPPIAQAVEGAPEQIDLSELLHHMGGEVYPLPRFWFSSETHSTLIQVQRNAFCLNWRRGEGVYPHYESVETDFWSAFEGYKRFVEGALEGKLDVVKRCELTYVNLIGTSNFFSCPAAIKHVLPPIAGLCDVQKSPPIGWPQRVGNVPADRSSSY
jgi:uncharacterized protein (TIGR04255 family)